ncbi:MAG TPA: alkaline phosphatase family protein [Gemmataceae bacterium]|nr:alkaline phosphatase family protein [Gemmataceae bacterium]
MQTFWRYLQGACVLVLVAAVPAWLLTTSQESPRPKLVVLVVFDQMRGDYVKKWQPLFGEGGFKRLQTEGAWYSNCHYPYAYTLTAAGHTSLVTGTTPSVHGVIANDWYDRAEGDSVSSVTPPPNNIARGVGPYRRKAESVGDVLLRVLLGKGRVVSLSIKDRAAILMAALRANLCYWFNSQTGDFRTSAYYRPDPHSWVLKFNKARPADQWLGKNWDRFDLKLDYVKFSGPDDFISEGSGYLQGQTFPHPFKEGKSKDKAKNKQNYYDAVTCSPMGNELLLDFAKAAIVNEKLGQSDKVDLLCVSFSSNDLIGHCWGPDSQEVLDVTLRSDALIKNLLDFLDDKVGQGNYYFAVSADHGVCPLPEFAAKYEKKVAQRIEPELLTTHAENFLNKKFLPDGEKAPWLVLPRRGNSWIYLNHATLKEWKLSTEEVEKALAQWYNEQPGIERAVTRTEILKARRDGLKELAPVVAAVDKSFHPDCSGDVMVILKPYHLFSMPTLSKNPDKLPSYRTTHGTPHPYDTHVPLLVMGPRIVPGERGERVAPQSMASILADALGVPHPKNATYGTPKGLFK